MLTVIRTKQKTKMMQQIQRLTWNYVTEILTSEMTFHSFYSKQSSA